MMIEDLEQIGNGRQNKKYLMTPLQRSQVREKTTNQTRQKRGRKVLRRGFGGGLKEGGRKSLKGGISGK